MSTLSLRNLQAISAAVFVLAGCASMPIDDQIAGQNQAIGSNDVQRECDITNNWNYAGFDLQNHVIVAGSDGQLISHGGSNRDAADRLIDNIVRWNRVRVERKKQAGLKNVGPARIVFYFNGGLNSRETVLQQAARQVPCMLSDGVYPVFMVWDTQLWHSYREQVFFLRDGQLDSANYLTGAFYVLGDVIEGLGRAPSTYAAQSRRYINTLRPDRACDYTVLASTRSGSCPALHQLDFVGPDGQVGRDRNVLVDLARVDDVSRDVLDDVGYAALLPLRLITTPFVDGAGNTAWSNFERRTRTPIRKPREFDLYHHTCLDSWREDRVSFPAGTGAFSRVFRLLALAKLGDDFPANEWTCQAGHDENLGVKTEPAEKEAFRNLDLSIVMIGHSMGAIAVNELVSIYRDLPYSDIVYMAAASSIRDTRRAIEPLLLQHPKLRFYNLMLHPLNDVRERYYAGAVPGGSLLIWIDEMYEPALTPDDKTMGFWPNAKASRHLFWTDGRDDDGPYNIREHMLYRVFNRKEAVCTDGVCEPPNPTGHGDFNQDEMCFWRPAFWGAADTTWRERYRDIPQGLVKACRVPGDAAS